MGGEIGEQMAKGRKGDEGEREFDETATGGSEAEMNSNQRWYVGWEVEGRREEGMFVGEAQRKKRGGGGEGSQRERRKVHTSRRNTRLRSAKSTQAPAAFPNGRSARLLGGMQPGCHLLPQGPLQPTVEHDKFADYIWDRCHYYQREHATYSCMHASRQQSNNVQGM